MRLHTHTRPHATCHVHTQQTDRPLGRTRAGSVDANAAAVITKQERLALAYTTKHTPTSVGYTLPPKMLRGRLACFAAPWRSSSSSSGGGFRGGRTGHEDGESEDEGRESLAGAGVWEPSSTSSFAAGGSGACVRWTLRGAALRKATREQVSPGRNQHVWGDRWMDVATRNSRSTPSTYTNNNNPQVLDRMARELLDHQHDAPVAAASPQPPLVVSTEAAAWLVAAKAEASVSGDDPVLQGVLDYCGRVETVRVVERDRRRSHGACVRSLARMRLGCGWCTRCVCC